MKYRGCLKANNVRIFMRLHLPRAVDDNPAAVRGLGRSICYAFLSLPLSQAGIRMQLGLKGRHRKYVEGTVLLYDAQIRRSLIYGNCNEVSYEYRTYNFPLLEPILFGRGRKPALSDWVKSTYVDMFELAYCSPPGTPICPNSRTQLTQDNKLRPLYSLAVDDIRAGI